MAQYCFSVVFALGIGFLSHFVDCSTPKETCASLAGNLRLPNVQVQFTQHVTAETNLNFLDYPAACVTATGQSASQVVHADLCRVALLIHTSPKSSMSLEAWLPTDWNGRFLSGGNGGYTGCIGYADLAYGTRRGFATVSGNNGHNGTSAAPFYKHLDVLADYAYRAIHTGATVGQQVATAFYGKKPTKAYFMSCSGGGRQGLKLAQDFPGVFDGIIALCPAIDFVNFVSWGAWLSILNGFDGSATKISLNQWNAIHEEVMRQCDGLDGAIDGVIEDPDLCHPVFETMICKAGASDISRCLTGDQARRVRQVYEPLYGLDGNLVYPRQQPGGEAIQYSSYVNGTPSYLGSEWYRYVVYNPSHDARSLTRVDFALADKMDPYGISTWKADLSGFKKRGGKLMLLHGLEDGIISSEISSLYYHRVSETMGLNPSSLDEWFRYFRISGMGHCALGTGAWRIGMYDSDGTLSEAPEDNVLSRIVAWVEDGDAPEFVRGASLNDGIPGTGTNYTRKHCKYPARNVYIGPQSYTDENAWQCQ